MYSGTALVAKEPPTLKATKIVGLISDTHIPKQVHCLPKKVLEVFEKVDYIIHVGDLVELAVVDELEQLAPVLAVHGNMDGMEVAAALPRLNSLKVFDWKIGVMHDPDIAFGFNRMRDLVKEHEFNIFVYGHTHAADIKWEGSVLYINPGSPTVRRSVMDKFSVGLLKITKDSITPEIVDF
jgi:putative phosphoesterase